MMVTYRKYMGIWSFGLRFWTIPEVSNCNWMVPGTYDDDGRSLL